MINNFSSNEEFSFLGEAIITDITVFQNIDSLCLFPFAYAIARKIFKKVKDDISPFSRDQKMRMYFFMFINDFRDK